MRFNKNVQYALLFTLYLCRAGKATVDTASQNLGLSRTLLEQVSRKLRIAGIFKSTKGPSGGYELVTNPTVLDLIKAVDKVEWLKVKEVATYQRGESEHRALVCFARRFGKTTATELNKTVRSLNNDLLIEEMNQFDKPITGMDV